MKKIEANQLQRLSVFELHQKGFLSKDHPIRGACIAWLGSDAKKHRACFSVRLPESLKKLGLVEFSSELMDICLTATECNFRGVRYWFLCPTCERRVGVLYNMSGKFICRHCGQLTYSSRNQTKSWRCNVSIIDLDAATKQVRRKYYNGKPTRKYRRLLRMEAEFEDVFKQITGLKKLNQ